MNGISRLSAELTELAEAPAPPSRVDVDRARQRGRSMLRRRRLTVVGAVAAVVVTAVALASLTPGGPSAVGPAEVSVSPTPPGPFPSGSGAASGPAAPVASQTAAVFSTRDPITVDAMFGWLPESIRSLHYQTGSPQGPQVRAEESALGSGSGVRAFYDLSVYPEGVNPPLGENPVGSPQTRKPAPPVQGREAYWVVSPNAEVEAVSGVLRWKTAEERWAQLRGSYVHADKEQVMLRIAEGATIGRLSVPLPFKVAPTPPGWVLSSISFDRRVDGQGAPPWSISMGFSVGPGRYFVTDITPDGPTATPSVPPGFPTGRVGPHACRTGNGLNICVAPLQEVEMLDPVGGMEGWLDRVTLLGTDESRWTTDVLG